MNYYNEFDKKKVAWLRELIKAGHIPYGDVDDRSVLDVRPADLLGYSQCHWFAGIGVWSLALRNAGFPEDREVWTGSCPCQPFSAAGRKEGIKDERHLWPAWFELIRQCRPSLIFGEQVMASTVIGKRTVVPKTRPKSEKEDGPVWLDVVYADLEAAHYAVGAVGSPACGFGAPHIRQRLYFVGVADTNGQGLEGRPSIASDNGQERPTFERASCTHVDQDRGTGPTNGFWGNADWVRCRDDKWRAVESSHEFMADGITSELGSCGVGGRTLFSPLIKGGKARVARLRGFGDAIVAPQAQAFIEAYLESSSVKL